MFGFLTHRRDLVSDGSSSARGRPVGQILRRALPTVALAVFFTLFTAPAVADCVDYGDYIRWLRNVDPQGAANGLAISGNYAYLAGGSIFPDVGKLWVIDLTSFQMVSTIALPTMAFAVTIMGTHAYVAAGLSGLRVIDIMNPQSPQIVGSLDTPETAYGIAVSGTHAYVACDLGGLRVVDIANPLSPQIVGSVDTQGQALAVAVSGSYAYLGDGISIKAIDISDPESPLIVGAWV
jgi:hypothetical protein